MTDADNFMEFLKQQKMPPGSPPGAGGGPLVTPRVTVYPETAPRKEAIDFWKSQGGVPQHVAEGIADNVGRESSYRPDVMGDSGTSGGLYQAHDDRLSDLEKKVPDWRTNPIGQHKWALGQVMGGDPTATSHWNEIKGAKTREEARDLFKQYFERPASTVAVASGKDPWEGHTIGVGNNRVSDEAVEAGQKISTAAVKFAAIDQLLGMVDPRDDDKGSKAKLKSVKDSLLAGDEIQTLPRVDVERKGDRLKITDYDMRNRLTALKEAGVEMVPVMFAGAGNLDGVKEIEDMHGNVRPFDFRDVPRVSRETSYAKDPRFNPWMRPIETAKAIAASFAPSDPQAAQQHIQQAGAPPRAYLNEAGQPFTLTGQPPPQPQPSPQPQPPPQQPATGIFSPAYDIPYVGSLSEMIGQIARGAVEGGQRALGVGEEGRDPLRPLSPDIMAATGAFARGVGLGSRAAPATAAPLQRNALAALTPEGRALTAGAEAARAAEFPKPVPMSLLTPERAALAKEGADRFNLPLYGPSTPETDIALKRAWQREIVRTGGEDAPVASQEVLRRGLDRVGDTIERIEQGHRVNLDSQFRDEMIGTLRDVDKYLTESQSNIIRKQVININQHVSLGATPASQSIPGKAYGELMKRNAALDKAVNSGDPGVSRVAGEIREHLRNAMQRSLPPDVADEYRNARYQYKNLKTIERAVVGSPTGDIDPAKLDAAVTRSFERRATDVGGTALDRLGKIGTEFVAKPRLESATATDGRNALRHAIVHGIGGGLGQMVAPGLVGWIAGAAVFHAADRVLQGRMRPKLTENLVMRALAKPTMDKRNAIAAMMSGRGANTLTAPPPAMHGMGAPGGPMPPHGAQIQPPALLPPPQP